MKSKKEIKENEIKEQEVKETPAVQPSGKKGVKIAKTVLNVFVNVLIVLVLIVSIVIATMALTSKKSGVSTIFGRTVQTIQSDSMMGGSPDGYEGGDFKTGDLVLGWATDYDEYAEYDLGDVVTFKEVDTDGRTVLVVHRIVDKIKGEDGSYRYQTWGDNREVAQVPDQQKVEDYLAAFDIASVVCSKDHSTTVLKGFGGFLDYIRSSKGFFLVVLLPMILFFAYAIVRVIINMQIYRKTKAAEDAEDAEVQKQAEIDAAVKAALAAAGVDKKSPESENSAEENKE